MTVATGSTTTGTTSTSATSLIATTSITTTLTGTEVGTMVADSTGTGRLPPPTAGTRPVSKVRVFS